MKKGKKTSLLDLAAHLKLSPTTISRGLADYPEVALKTRERIRKAADTLNYHPSSSAIKLATGQSHTIGHVVPVSEHMMINPFYADFIAGAGDTYQRHGYDILLSVVPKINELKAYRELAITGKVDGFIVSEAVQDDPRIHLLSKLDIPFIMHGRSEGTANHQLPEHDWLDVNNRRGFQEAVNYLIGKGHHDIGFINGPSNLRFSQQREKGFYQAMKGARLAVHHDWIMNCEMREMEGYRLTKAILKQKKCPSAIIYSSLIQAMGAQRAVQEKQLTMGKDISIMCWDDCLSALYHPSDEVVFTAMRLSLFEAGQKVAEMIIKRLAEPARAPMHELLEAELTIGYSVGKGPNHS